MKNQFILTPYFLDRYDPALIELALDDWIVNNPSLPSEDEISRLQCIHCNLANWVTESVANGNRPVSVAGDCCATIPVMAGLQRSGIQPIFFWLDAHGDFNTWETTPSGFLGGMPLAMMTGKGDQRFLEHLGMDKIPEVDVVLSDGRDLDPDERKLFEASQIQHIRYPLDLLNHKYMNRPVYIHFDTDLIDPREAPAMGYPASGGPSSSDLEKVFNHFVEHCDIVALSISTWRSNMDVEGSTKSVCMNLFDILTG